MRSVTTTAITICANDRQDRTNVAGAVVVLRSGDLASKRLFAKHHSEAHAAQAIAEMYSAAMPRPEGARPAMPRLNAQPVLRSSVRSRWTGGLLGGGRRECVYGLRISLA